MAAAIKVYAPAGSRRAIVADSAAGLDLDADDVAGRVLDDRVDLTVLLAVGSARSSAAGSPTKPAVQAGRIPVVE